MKKMLFIMPVALVSLFAFSDLAKASLPIEDGIGKGEGLCQALSQAELDKISAYNLYFDESGHISPTVTYSNAVSECPTGTHATDNNCCCVPDNAQ